MIPSYDPPPYRPPNEANSVLIRVTRGCPWNRCAFCDMYKRIGFEKKSVEQLEAEIKTAGRIYGTDSKELFIGDSNSLTVRELPEILRIIHREFPALERVTSYARSSTLKRLGLKRLRELREAGLDRVHVGLESGDDGTLMLLNKGATAEVMIEGGRLAKLAGLEVCEYVLLGAGGVSRWREHARGTAAVLNAVEPDFIRLRTLTIQNGTPLSDMVRTGLFIQVTPLIRLKETLMLIEALDVPESLLASDHVTNYLYAGGRIIFDGVNGHLPQDKQDMVGHLQNTLAFIESYNGEIWDSNYMLQKGYLVGL